jgi:alkylhydroperoxidase family enzyme
MTTFPIHTPQDAPEAARPALAGLGRAFGFVPNVAATMAGSPPLLNAFAAAAGQFGDGTFTAGERQVLLLTNAVTNGSEWAVAFHSTAALAAGVAPADVAAVRARQLPADPRLAALSALTRALIEKRGHLDDADATAFTDAGFAPSQLLEVLTGVAISAMANYTGNLARPPLEARLRPQAWENGY